MTAYDIYMELLPWILLSPVIIAAIGYLLHPSEWGKGKTWWDYEQENIAKRDTYWKRQEQIDETKEKKKQYQLELKENQIKGADKEYIKTMKLILLECDKQIEILRKQRDECKEWKNYKVARWY